MSTTPRNDRTSAVTQFCLAMEEDRRAPVGRVRTPREMARHFFPRSEVGAVDRVFVHVPPEVRGPIISGWKIRGPKSAARDTDEQVRQVVADALDAGDIDEATFEDGLSATILIDWVPLPAWWEFWRSGKLTACSIQKALATARSLGLFDDVWFLDNLRGRAGNLPGIDTICESLGKDQIVAWLHKVHESTDGSAAGLVASLGWDVILTKTSQQALLFALDALARRIGLASTPTQEEELERAGAGAACNKAEVGEPNGEPKVGEPDVSAPEVEDAYIDEAFVEDATIEQAYVGEAGVEAQEHHVDGAFAESGVHKAALRSYRPVDPSQVDGRRSTVPPPLIRRASGFHSAS